MDAIAQLGRKFELASETYAASNGITRSDDWFILKMQEELGELTQIYMKLTDRGRRYGKSTTELEQELANETADLLGHVLLFAHRHGLDLPRAIKRKWRFEP